MHAYAGSRYQPVIPSEYYLYNLGRTVLNSRCCLWFNWNWDVQFPSIAQLYDPAHPAQEWDIFASIRFEGQAYEDSQAEGVEETNRYYVDRVVLVKVEYSAIEV